MIDPDDTRPLPLPPPSVPRPPRRISRDDLADEIVDRRARELAEWCAGWRHRGYSVEELVGVVCNCWLGSCRTRVIPRADVGRKLSQADVAQTLTRAGSKAGRLTVAVCAEGFCLPRHIHVPTDVEVPDTRGLLVPLSAERRAFLDRVIAECGAAPRAEIRKFMHHEAFEEILVQVSPAYYFRRAYSLVWGHRVPDRVPDWDRPPARAHIAAARFDMWPGRILFMVSPDHRFGETHWSADWVDPRRVGFDEQEVLAIEHRCFEVTRKYELYA